MIIYTHKLKKSAKYCNAANASQVIDLDTAASLSFLKEAAICISPACFRPRHMFF